ncbi:MAG: 50S ribosomal protein L30 [Gemmatimonadota bacterium]|nr:MAG: 50S ribosomal protein L30 [Gemmatimonadota bacterium]
MPSKAAGSKKATKKTAKKKKTTAKAKAAKKSAGKAKPATSTKATLLRVRQVRSGIGHAETYRRTLRALGIKHHQDEVVVADGASARGMLHKVRHLVRVTPEEA